MELWKILVPTVMGKYFYRGKLWGLHTRGKLGQKRNKNRERIENQLKIVK